MTPLEQQLQEVLACNQAQQARIALLETENKLLREKVDLLVKRIFGAKSEQLDEAPIDAVTTRRR
nr:hypothetical protein [Phragmitibacter flavus]